MSEYANLKPRPSIGNAVQSRRNFGDSGETAMPHPPMTKPGRPEWSPEINPERAVRPAREDGRAFSESFTTLVPFSHRIGCHQAVC